MEISGAMIGGGSTARGAGGKVVVGTGGYVPTGRTGGRIGGKVGRGGCRCNRRARKTQRG